MKLATSYDCHVHTLAVCLFLHDATYCQTEIKASAVNDRSTDCRPCEINSIARHLSGSKCYMTSPDELNTSLE